jgi:dTDP-4-dehydrorhamnose reductase
MHVLIVGGRGQLGRALQEVYRQLEGVEVTVWTRDEHHLGDARICDAVTLLKPDLVVNAAAWTNVDGAEADPDGAYAANMLGPLYLAQGCYLCGAEMVHVSTNEVFAGEPSRVYREYDLPMPASTYARSKWAGEQAAARALRHLFIVRVAWLFGPGGNHFPSKIISAADQRGALRVVNDEYGNPTYTVDAAIAIAKIVEMRKYGTFHLVNEGAVSRFDFARETLALTGRGDIPLTPIPAAEWPRPAPPPLHAVLANQVAANHGIVLRPWQEALAEYLTVNKDRYRRAGDSAESVQ